MELIFDEIIESKKEMFDEVMRIAYKDKHNFLFVNVPSSKMFINWDELQFSDDFSSDEL